MKWPILNGTLTYTRLTPEFSRAELRRMRLHTLLAFSLAQSPSVWIDYEDTL